MVDVPYFCQWESADRAADILAGRLALEDDPAWPASGAATAAEYAQWANHICGMACLKMALAAFTGRVYPTLVLARLAEAAGAYVVQPDDIQGLIYAPLLPLLQSRFGLTGAVRTGLTAADLPGLLTDDALFMASVHPAIRWLAGPPPRKGGHLVLVTAADAERVLFHNPSGHDAAAQRHAAVPLARFDEYFAGRGILLWPPAIASG